MRRRGGRGWWGRRSLRARLTAASVLVIGLGMASAAILLVWRLRSNLVTGIDDLARQRARDVVAAVSAGGATNPVLSGVQGSALIQVVDSAGRVVASSSNASGEPRLFRFPPSTAENPPAQTIRAIAVGDATTYRVVAVPADTGAGRYVVYAGVAADEVERSVAELSAALSVGVPALVGLFAIVGWIVLGRALRPVEALRQQAAEISASDLHRRLTVPPSRDELARLAGTLNDMLARLDASAQQQRQFVADAAHELRSPIAALRAQLEVAARDPERVEWAASLPDLVGDSVRLSRLVDDLVYLARHDAQPGLRWAAVDLDEIVFQELRRIRDRVAVDQSAVSGARLMGDEVALHKVVRNLVDNAARHARRRVAASLTSMDGKVRLVVADDGPGIPAADRTRVFERFTRLDEGRDRDAGGSGLGLAIVRDVVNSHGGQVRVEDNAPGARFVVELPAGVAPQPDAAGPARRGRPGR